MVRAWTAHKGRMGSGLTLPALMLLYNNVAELRQIVGEIVFSTISKGSVLQAAPEKP
jgi:hypothetical protein